MGPNLSRIASSPGRTRDRLIQYVRNPRGFNRNARMPGFAGRIADTGRDPLPLMTAAVELMKPHPTQELIWASPRELLNIFQADAIGCHIITVTHDVLKKLDLVGKDLSEYSLDTVRMFYNDAKAAGFTL